MLMYWTKMYGSQDKLGKEYVELNRAIQIIITDFSMFLTDRFYSRFRLMNDVDQVVFTDHIEMHVLQLPKINTENIVETNELEKWLLFLKSDQKTKEALAMESSTMKEVYEEIQRLSQNPETRRLVNYWDHELRGQMQREADSRDEGRNEGKTEIIVAMFKKNIPYEDIANLTDVPLEQVKEVTRSMDQQSN